MPNTKGTIRIFQLAGISVFLHWSWFLLGIYEIQGKGRYSSVKWNILEYLTLFAIVTMHEFGHALACRQVGGTANQIILWPLGGVAYVNPPSRPGANLWSISAGPLVNLALMPVLGLLLLGLPAASGASASDFAIFVRSLNLINLALFLFNVLPIFPLDGGKILRSLLWYVVGPARSLMAAVIVGFVGIAGLGVLAFSIQSAWLGILTVFAGLQCASGFRLARTLKRLESTPRREDYACPSCKANPPLGAFWSCGVCKSAFDTFEVQAKCPKCYTLFPKTTCTECGTQSSVSDWYGAAAAQGSPESLAHKADVPLTSPSIIPVVLGVTASLGAAALLLLSLLFFKISTDEAFRQPRYQTEIETLWLSEGLAVPGEQILTLSRGERYDAYVERNVADRANNNGIDIRIRDADSGVPVPLTHSINKHPLQRNNRMLSSTASFSVPQSGRYAVHASTRSTESATPRIKIGPSLSLVNGTSIAVARGVAIGAGAVTAVLTAAAVLLFLIYRRRRREFHLVLNRSKFAPL